MSDQHSLFGDVPGAPEGFRYERLMVPVEMESALVAEIQLLPFENFQFHGFEGKRRVVSYGWKYDFTARKLREADEIPIFLLPLRELAADFAGHQATDLGHALVTEYSAGAAIGWHRDKSEFGDIVGISLVSECTFRMRRKRSVTWERFSQLLEPRSSYVMRGPSRTEWEHSIPAVSSVRYSITFRTLAGR